MVRSISEPTHVVDGAVIPGARDLREAFTAEDLAANDAASRDASRGGDHTDRLSGVSPHHGETFAPLEELQQKALMLHHPTQQRALMAETSELFILFGNMIIEDLRAHPYWEIPEISYYTSIHERRPIPDIIMVLGLRAYYADEAGHELANKRKAQYRDRMNTVLHNRKNGSGQPLLRGVDT